MPKEPKFLFLGGRLCLDFVNTEIVIRGQRVDLLSDFAQWMAWHAEAGAPKEAEVKSLARRWRTGAQGTLPLRRAIAFRSRLRQMAHCMAAQRPVPKTALTAINDLLRRGAAYEQLARAGRGFVRQMRRDLEDPLDLLVPVAEDAARLLCEGNPARIRKCGNPACVLFFYDTSKSHTRQWCSMKLCGNRAKVAAHYRRRREP